MQVQHVSFRIVQLHRLPLIGFFKGGNGAYAPNQGGNQSKFVVLGFRPIAGIFLSFHDA